MIKAQIFDVFCDELAQGNPCGVVELNHWLSDSELLHITHQVAQPVTSFVVQSGSDYHIRWFSLEGEINLCGHGSLGAGAAIISNYHQNEVILKSQYGHITVTELDGMYRIVMPSWQVKPHVIPLDISGFSNRPVDAFTTRDLVVVLESEDDVAHYKPNFDELVKIDEFHAVIVTAQSSDSGYVLRYFAPKIGISEDLATGSAQCSLAPYWFEKLGKEKLMARQLSRAGGYFEVARGSESTIVLSAHVKSRT
ncbi:TPA: PhzF family phenazine biosynthesis protein [Vibrio diabolicus]